MFILCDTSSILMLLRIAPDMFIDERYECKTIRVVHDEIVRTTKFKVKYPWMREMRAKVKPMVLNEKQKQTETAYWETIHALNNFGTVNNKTGQLIDLSWVDIGVISHALALEYKITSGDVNLLQFARQEFKEEFRGSVSPLEMINHWLESGVIEWDEEKQRYISAWMGDNEHPQPPKEKKRFRHLAGNKYTGS
ncbi:hypothetical protein QA601_07750 [Chitinispirillales bacterium ANBcel5]|uniref:hypothetical protein n=1 Tax=Cellulosispirillum alkaliphilum TaxID=3039283 RepID=UPI002A57E847|nr:hypothetical protein [Chitinispirillales bacterium ANBcel5]